MRYVKDLLSAVLAGVCIAMGGIAYLSIENTVAGALFFCLGLFVILTHSLNLFTGKVCFALDEKPRYILTLAVIYIGNLIGAAGTGLLVSVTRIGERLGQRAADICSAKTGDGVLSLFILGILCNVLIYVAVWGYRENKHDVGKYLALMFGVAAFVVCGFEHCVANMFYFTVAGAWGADAVICLIAVTAGNIVGGLLFPLFKKIIFK